MRACFSLVVLLGSVLGVQRCPAAEKVALDTIIAPYIGDGLEWAVTPTPREAVLAREALVADGVEIIVAAEEQHKGTKTDALRWAAALTPTTGAKQPLKVYLGVLGDGSKADQLLKPLGLVLSTKKRALMGEQGYVLFVGELPGSGEAVVAIAGVGPAGTYYGLQSLRQLTHMREGKVYVRMGRLIDWPAMPWRGSKRPLAWEELYKANFGPLRGSDNKEHFRVHFGTGISPQRGLKSWEVASGVKTTAGRGLDVSDAYLDWLFPQWEAHYRKTGDLLYTVQGDDIELALDEKSGTLQRFKGDYGAAFVHLLTELNRRLKKLDPRCTLYWMPNPYYTVNWDFELLSKQVRDAGGLPSDIGLWWTGHYVFSGVMTADDISGYQRAFYGKNPIKTRGLIYDNHGRADERGRMSDYFAMPARDPEIANYLNGISNERGSWINRITSYDFQWNPQAYKTERSLKLAVRELANRDPAYYKLLLEFVQTWEASRYPTRKETTHAAAVAGQQLALAKLKALQPRLKAAGEAALMSTTITWDSRDGDFRKQFLNQVLGSIGQKEAALAALDFLWRDANAPAYILPAGAAPKIDGKLDDACYQRPPTFDKFYTNGGKMVGADKQPLWEVAKGIVPQDLSTQGWICADERCVYLAFRCQDKAYPRPPGQQASEPSVRAKVGNDHPYCWRQPCLDINLDVKHDKRDTFHLIFDPLGQVFDEYLGWPGDPLPTGPRWSLGNNFKVVRDGASWTVEAAIPLEKLGLTQVKSGEVWGANVYRPGVNVVSMFSQLYDTGPYGVRYPQVFGYVQWK